jgi:hypothetical protein
MCKCDLFHLVYFLITLKVYGRKMTALVLDSASRHRIDIEDAHKIGDEDKDDYDAGTRSIQFGDHDERLAKAHLVDVKCR